MTKQVDGIWKVVVFPNNYTSSETLTFKVSVFVTKCLFWDTDLGDWSREGCMVRLHNGCSFSNVHCLFITFMISCLSKGWSQYNAEPNSVPVQPHDVLWELLFCDAQPSWSDPDSSFVCHSKWELYSGGFTQLLLCPLPCGCNVGLVCRPQSSENGTVYSCLLAILTHACGLRDAHCDFHLVDDKTAEKVP